MKIEIKNNNFIELSDLIKINYVNCILEEYFFENKTLKGLLKMEGEYVKDSSNFDTPFNFFNSVPFEIVFVEDINDVKNVWIDNFEYFEVERRGIETETTLIITNEEERNDNAELNITEDNFQEESEKYIELKNEVENEITDLLDKTFNIDNNCKKEDNIFPTTTKRTKIRIFGHN